MGKNKDLKVTKQQQQQFWKHNINPITGWKVKSTKQRFEKTDSKVINYGNIDTNSI